MVWLERPDGLEYQRSFKLRDMTQAVEWSDNGLAQVTERNAELAVEAGLAEYRDDEGDDEDEDVEPEPEDDAGPPLADALSDADGDADEDEDDDD